MVFQYFYSSFKPEFNSCINNIGLNYFYLCTILILHMIMRSLFKLTFRSLPPLLVQAPTLHKVAKYNFAKVSKKQQQKAQKNKQKSQAKQSLGGNINEIDLNKYDQNYTAVVQSFKQQISGIRMGRLEVSTLNSVAIKVGNQNMVLSGLAQISSKGANICVISPFDSDQVDVIQKSIKLWDDGLEIKRVDKTLVLTQLSQGKQVREKLVQKVKKLSNDRKEELKRIRSNTQEQLKKYKKLIPEDRFRTIQTEAKVLFDKRNVEIQKMQKDKEKELMK